MRFDVLESSIRRERKSREFERQGMLQRIDATLTAMARRYDLGEVYIFGSVIREGRFSGSSDVDVAVDTLGAYYWTFAAELSEAIGRDVDVVELDSSPVAARIRKEGRPWTPQL